MLEEIKTRLSITGEALNATIQGLIEDVIAFCISAGVSAETLQAEKSLGLIARGVADLWQYGAGEGKFSQAFMMRLTQLCAEEVKNNGSI